MSASIPFNTMKRPVVVVALVVCVLVSGCAHRQDLLRPGEDPEELVTSIALRGQGQGPPQQVASEVPDSSMIGDCLKVAVKACACCLGLSLWIVYCLAQSNPRF
jgi:hypothetical protein